MKTIKILLIIVMPLLFSCSKFWEDSLVGPDASIQQSDQVVSLVLGKALPDSAYFKSNIFLSDDSTSTVYQEVMFSDSLMINTLVSESQAYKGRVSSQGIVYFSNFTVGGVIPTHWTLSVKEGPWFWGDVDLAGNFIQAWDNLADTIVVPVSVYAPAGNDYYFNGTGTDFTNRYLPWNDSLNCYHVNLTTLPGTHNYDWWGPDIDSVQLGTATIYEIGGEYIRFEIAADQVVLLDSLAENYKVAWTEEITPDSVKLSLFDHLGSRDYFLLDQIDEWSRQVVIPSDSLIYLRLEADGVVQFTRVKVQNTELCHLIEREPEQYWFAFRVINQEVVQDSNNTITTLNINPKIKGV